MRHLVLVAAALAESFAFGGVGFAQRAGFPARSPSASIKSVKVSVNVHQDVSRPLRHLVSAASSAGQTEQILRAANGPIPLNAGAGPALVRSFPGIATPPGFMGTPFATDATGAAGPDHYLQAVNFSAAIYDKTGNLLLGPFPTAQFWNGFSGPCGGGWSDVIVLYDHDAQRWFVSRFARQNNVSPLNWYQCFAISQTSDPTGQYNRYAFLIDAEEFNDYPKFSIWPDAYYMTADRDKIFPGKGNFVAAFERSKMLAGLPAASVIFKLDNNGKRAGMLPADWDGHTPPPTGSPNYFVRTLDVNLGWPAAGLEVWALQVDWANAVFNLSLQTTLSPAAFNSAICGLNQSCIPQPNTAQGLDPLAGGRPMMRAAYRNFGNHEALTFNQTVDAGNPVNHAGIRWYELRKIGGGAWSIFQQNTFAPDGDHRWIGSLAMDQAGNMLLGYNVSGSVFPSLRIAGRLASDAPGTMSELLTLQAGSGAQTGFVFWGDYSHTSLDPIDDCTFWHVGSFQPVTSNQQSWATQIAALRYPGCEADLAVTKSRMPLGLVTTGTNVTYTVSLTNNGPNYAGNITVTDAVPAGTSFVSLASSLGWSCTSPGVGGTGAITCKKGSVAVGELANFTVIATINCNVPDGTIINNTVSATAATPPDNNPANNTAMTTTMASNPAPVITCPKDQIAVAPKPGDTSAIVTYPAPTVMDNCPGATVVCSPTSGSVFPLGTTTVNCTATDTGGRMASCSFKVTVFDVCLQDNASGDFLVFNSFTGEYLFTRCATGFTLAGIGKITRTGCLTKLTEAKIEATLDRCTIAPLNRGSATIKPNPIGGWFYINDTNTANNTCMCP